MLMAALRDALYVAFALGLFAIGLHVLVIQIGFRYGKTLDTLDNDPIAISIFLGSLALAIAHIISTILH